MIFGIVAFVVQLAVVAGIVAAVVIVMGRKRSGGAPTDPNTPRDVFTYLLTAIALYITASGVVLILFGLADYWFPSFDSFTEPSTDDARIGISMAVVTFPLLLYLTKLSRSRIRKGDASPDSRLRLAFIYLSFFVVAVVVLVDLMVVVYDLLSGDLTARFLVKALGLLVVAALVFAYYRQELEVHPDEARPSGIPEPEGAA